MARPVLNVMDSIGDITLHRDLDDPELMHYRPIVHWSALTVTSLGNRLTSLAGQIQFELSEAEFAQLKAAFPRGRFAHNLRSALDHIVYALISTNPAKPEGVPDSRTMFPIRDTKEGYLHQVTKLRRIHGTPDAVAALIDSLQPYHSRDKGLDYTAHPLWLLDRLENIDKHRRLMLASGVARHAHVSIRYTDGGETDLLIMQDRIYDRAILTSYPPGTDGEVQMDGYLMVYIALREVDELPSFVDEDIFRILAQLLDYVGNLVMPRFARLAAGHATPPKKGRRQDFRPVLRGRRTGPR